MTPGDRILVTMPRSAPREGEYIEDRGSRARVLLDGDTETCVVLRERVRAVAPKATHENASPERRPGGCSVRGCTRQRGYYLDECYEHAGPDPYADDEPRPVLRAVPKPPKPWRSDAYMAFVRDFDCCWCGAATRIEAHHHGPHALGQKTDDARCIPVCRTCHRHYHDHGAFNADERLGADGSDADVIARAAQVECLRAWYAYREMDADAVIVNALIAHLRESQT